MPARKLTVNNNQSFELDRIPLLDENTFRRQILIEVRSGGRIAAYFGLREKNGDIRLLALLAHDEKSKLAWISSCIFKESPFFTSLTPEIQQAHLFEREIAEQFSVKPEGHPWLKPVRSHKNDYVFFQAMGEEIHEVAVGPVHAGIIEPGHFRFQCHGETILNLEIRLGYQHRGIEKMVSESPSERCALLAESIAGDTVIGHVTAYCGAIESLAACPVSARAHALRAVAFELERLANHTGDLGALGSDIGFVTTTAFFGRLKGEFLNLLMELTGSRYGRSFCRPGGVLFDMDSPMAERFLKKLVETKKEIQEVSDLFLSDSSVLSRLENTGVISPETVKSWGFVGLTARACGYARDVRTDYAYGMYRFHHVPVSSADAGDAYSRAMIRWLECQRSIDFLIELLRQMPKGALMTPLGPLKKDAVALSMVEGWRGEIIHAAITGADAQIARYKIKDPSFNNWTALELAVRGGQISDFPLCNKSFNLSYAGHDL